MKRGRFMKIFFLLIISMFIFSCSKEVASTSTNLTPSTTNPVVEVPSDLNSGQIGLTFANHSTLNDPDDELTSYSLSEPLLLTLPNYVSSFTFSSSSYKPNLIVLINNMQVCAYVWNSTSYQKSQNCSSDLDLTPNDVIQVLNIPKSQTISLQVKYQR